jgi:beclin 1
MLLCRDVAENRSPPFEFPFPIEGDKVGNYTIKLSGIVNKDTKWTKALKLMLADLKMALQWMIKKDGATGYRQLPTLAQEGPVTAVPSA